MDIINYIAASLIIYLVIIFGVGSVFGNPSSDVIVASSVFWGFVLLGYVQISLHKE